MLVDANTFQVRTSHHLACAVIHIKTHEDVYQMSQIVIIIICGKKITFMSSALRTRKTFGPSMCERLRPGETQDKRTLGAW